MINTEIPISYSATQILLGLCLVILNQTLKNVFTMPSKYAVLVNWVLGIIINMLVSGFTIENALQGFLVGCISSGLYSTKYLLGGN